MPELMYLIRKSFGRHLRELFGVQFDFLESGCQLENLLAQPYVENSMKMHLGLILG